MVSTKALVKVVDSSALGAIAFNEPAAGKVANELENAQLVVLTLLYYEMASVCHMKLMLYPEQREAIRAAFADLPKLRIERFDVDDRELVDIAERLQVTAYDAAYLWLAEFLSAELVTLDDQLAKAAKRSPGRDRPPRRRT